MPLSHDEWLALRERRQEIVNTTACPLCKASPGTPCLSKRGIHRKANHWERSVVAAGKEPVRKRGPRPQPTY